MSHIENVGRCPRCSKFMVAEEWKTHECDYRNTPIRDATEILLDHLTDLGENKNKDHTYLAWALDGRLYRLVDCKHNPPHSTKRKFTDQKPNGDLTEPGKLPS